MKIRNSFVSNSSSTSFVCVVCGEEEVGWDGEYSFDVYQCNECCNLMCASHIHKKHCPVCNLDYIEDHRVLDYLQKLSPLKIDIEQLKKDIKEEYGTFQKLNEALK